MIFGWKWPMSLDHGVPNRKNWPPFPSHHAYVTIFTQFADVTNFQVSFSTRPSGCQSTVCFRRFQSCSRFQQTQTPSRTHSDDIYRVPDGHVDIAAGSWHDVLWTNWVFFTKMTRHGRRHKSVWDLSRRVWEATRQVYSGSTRGSTTHRSRCENGDEQSCQKESRSVILRDSVIKVAMKIKTAR